MARFLKFLKDQRGFTLIELLAVAVILAILAVLAVPAVSSSISKAKLTAAKDMLGKARDAVNRYQVDVGPSETVAYPAGPYTSATDFASGVKRGTTQYFNAGSAASTVNAFHYETNGTVGYCLWVQATDSASTYIKVIGDGTIIDGTALPTCP